jgi:mycothiol S-conjugate amidase
LNNADLEVACERLVRILREVRPQVVITYNKRGGYGHPDHVMVNRVSVAAFDASGDPTRFPQIPFPPWQPKKLYYTANPRSRLLRRVELLEKQGEPVTFDIDLLSTPDEEITTRIDVSPYIDRKLEAIYCHQSQIGPRSFVSRVDESERRQIMSLESFVCKRGCPDTETGEDDLFQGIRD